MLLPWYVFRHMQSSFVPYRCVNGSFSKVDARQCHSSPAGVIYKQQDCVEEPFHSSEITLSTLLPELDCRLHSLITESFQPPRQRSNKTSSHVSRSSWITIRSSPIRLAESLTMRRRADGTPSLVFIVSHTSFVKPACYRLKVKGQKVTMFCTSQKQIQRYIYAFCVFMLALTDQTPVGNPQGTLRLQSYIIILLHPDHEV